MTGTSMKAVRVLLWGLVALAVVGVLWVRLVAPALDRSVGATLGHGDYVLSTTDGRTFTEASLKGEPSAVFFGFTHCPEVCPTTMGDIAVWQEELASAGQGPLHVYFVTVDPERDTLEMLGDYVSWAPGVTGVTGSRAEIDKAISAFRVYARKVPLDDGGYTMDHSALVMLFDRNGNFSEPINYQEDYATALAKIRKLLNG